MLYSFQSNFNFPSLASKIFRSLSFQQRSLVCPLPPSLNISMLSLSLSLALPFAIHTGFWQESSFVQKRNIFLTEEFGTQETIPSHLLRRPPLRCLSFTLIALLWTVPQPRSPLELSWPDEGVYMCSCVRRRTRGVSLVCALISTSRGSAASSCVVVGDFIAEQQRRCVGALVVYS